MSQKNGCIRFCVKDGGTFIQIMPPQEGGTAVVLKLVMRLLEAKSFNDYNLKELSLYISAKIQRIYRLIKLFITFAD